MRHLLDWSDYSVEEIRTILQKSVELKSMDHAGDRPAVLEHKVVGLLFEKPSLRTRVSFESLASQTGGASLFLGQDVGWGKREPIQDFIPVLTSYLDCLVIRAKSHASVTQAAQYSHCPVINGLTDFSHPCQALADVLTIEELFPGRQNLKIAFVGDGNNVSFSLALLACKLGFSFVLSTPPGYELPSDSVDLITQQSATPELFLQNNAPDEAVAHADVVYTDVWASMGQETEMDKRRRDFRDFQVNDALMAQANPDAKFLHCLPARRGEEVTTSVIESDASAIVQQAENRLHAQKGLVVWLVNESEKKR